MGFNSNIVYTKLKYNIKDICPNVGKNSSGDAPASFPYCDMTIEDMPGGHYDMDNNEGSVTPVILITVYDNTSTKDTKCENISKKAKESMLSMGFKCLFGPAKIANADKSISRWVARYRRVVADGDTI